MASKPAQFSLKVIAIDHIFYQGRCVSLVIPTIDGEKGIMAHHEEMAIAVEIGEIRITKEDGTVMKGVVGTGMCSVANNRVTVLVDTAELPEEIDRRRAQEARERAEEQLRQKQSIIEYHINQAALARAFARLKETSGVHDKM